MVEGVAAQADWVPGCRVEELVGYRQVGQWRRKSFEGERLHSQLVGGDKLEQDTVALRKIHL